MKFPYHLHLNRINDKDTSSLSLYNNCKVIYKVGHYSNVLHKQSSPCYKTHHFILSCYGYECL